MLLNIAMTLLLKAKLWQIVSLYYVINIDFKVFPSITCIMGMGICIKYYKLGSVD